MPPAATGRSRSYVWSVAALGLAVAVGAAALLPRFGLSDAMGVTMAAAFAAFCLAAVLALQRSGMSFEIGGQRLTVTVEEAMVFLMLLSLSAPLTPLVVLGATLADQLLSRRRFEKVAFNVAVYTLAAVAAAALAAYLRILGLPPLIAAFPALAVYSLGSNLLVAGLFSLLEGKPLGETYAERFLVPAAIQISVGIGAGVVLYALYLQHPFATIGMAPFALLIRGYIGLAADANRKLAVHRRLAGVSETLAGSRDFDVIAQRVLETVGDVLQPGRLELTLDHGPQGKALTWGHTFEGGPALNRPAVQADLPGADGKPVGRLVAYPSQRNAAPYGAAERELLRIFAGQAAVAYRNALALLELAEVKDVTREVLENVPGGVARVDLHGRLVQVNPRMAEILGERDAASLVGRSIDELPLWRGDVAERVRQALRGQAFDDVETAAGPTIQNACGVPLRGHDGKLVGAVLLFTDITERKQVEEALRSQTLTRPFVRRLVLSIVSRMNAPQHVIAQVGRGLAGELKLDDIDDFTATFRSLGLGNLHMKPKEGENYVFEADDLLERRPKSSQPTCHLALGFVEGAVAAVRGGSLGSELRCQSQGHTHCVFVVQPRAVVASAPKRTRAPTR